MKKAIGSACLAGLLSMGMGTAAMAQTNTTQPATKESDNSGKIGLVGLAGLLGLAGLAKRDRRDDRDNRGTGTR